VVSRTGTTRLGAVVLAALTLSACAQQCTTAGCDSSVLVDVSAVQGLGTPQAGRVVVCIGQSTDCALAEAAQGQDVVPVVIPAGALPDDPSTGPVLVRIKIMNPGAVLVDDSVTTTFTSVRPNGEGCGPVCSSVRVVATDRGITALPVGATPASA
jgi:hypothetical protein